MDFFDLSKPCSVVKLKGGTTDGYVKADDSFKKLNKREIETGKNYAKPYIMKDKLDLLETNEKDVNEMEMESDHMRKDLVGDLTSVGTFPDINKLHDEDTEKLYAEYMKKPVKEDSNLVINQYKSKILPMIEANEVTIISGPTGCGKTTKVPQYILDSYAENNRYCNIIVSQPRRIAAITIARRVCEEREWPLPSICGYQVGLQKKVTQDTRLTYVTIGVLLQILLVKKNMNDYTHVILDEVHERDQETDFALLVIRQYLNWNSRNVKVILMSATADTSKFANYFERPLFSKFQPAPIIDIKKSNEYIVSVHYLDELVGLGVMPEVILTDPCITGGHIMVGINLIKRFEMLDFGSDKKSVLVFLPGIYEIEQFYEKLKNPQIYMCGNNEYKWHCIPLHSSITMEEQVQAFLPPPTGYRKIILATNIAESSITVPDVMFVIDYCLSRVLVTDPDTNLTCLQLAWASKDNLIQRAGRTGRVMNGTVYRMIYKNIYDELDDHCIPGMLRCPLERIVLQAKKLGIGSPKAVLALAVDPPDLRDITRTILILKEVGALLPTKNGHFCDNDGDLTSLGRLMASLPVDIHISKLIALGYVFNCLEECIIMGASMSLKSLFSSPFRAQMQSYNAKLDWADGSCSDCIAFLNVYQVWKEHHKSGYFKRSVSKGEFYWAKRHFIQMRTLKEVDILVQEIKLRLKSLNLETPVDGFGMTWNDIEKSLILKFVIAGAFYPNYFTRGARGGQINEKEAVKMICGRDPFTTVYFQNYPLDQPPDLYSHLIFDKLRICRANMNISYDHGKVFIEFQNDDGANDNTDIPYKCKVPGKVPMAVYRAVKMREALKNFEISVLPSKEAKLAYDEMMKAKLDAKSESASGENSKSNEIFACRLPGVDVKFIDIVVTHIENPNLFWVAQNDSTTKNNERLLFRWLNGPEADLENLTSLPEIGDYLAAPYKTENEICMYRARVETVQKSLIKVFFIDYGNSEICTLDDLKKFGPKLWENVKKIPGQAFKCSLTKLRPSPIRNSNEEWCPQAKKRFAQLVDADHLNGNVYSVVHETVSMILYKTVSERGQQVQCNINKVLIDEGFAETEEETYLSQMNSEVRKSQQKGCPDEKRIQAYNSIQAEDALQKSSVFKYYPTECGQIRVDLRGPFSPLEMSIYSNSQGGTSKLIKIAPSSVNSVLIDSNPQDPHERLIVAGHIGQNQSGTTLILHNTTVMPNIHGLSGLIPLVFAPNVEFRVNDKKTSYTGILCGLGVDEEGLSLFPEHDMEVIFDCEFSFEDIVTINKLRYAMSNILGNGCEGTSYPDLITYQSQLKEAFDGLIHQSRQSKELEFPKKEFEWNVGGSNVGKENDFELKELNQTLIYPLFQVVRIRSREVERKKMLAHVEELRKIVEYRNSKREKLKCELCDTSLLNINFLALHLTSERHLAREEKLRTS